MPQAAPWNLTRFVAASRSESVWAFLTATDLRIVKLNPQTLLMSRPGVAAVSQIDRRELPLVDTLNGLTTLKIDDHGIVNGRRVQLRIRGKVTEVRKCGNSAAMLTKDEIHIYRSEAGQYKESTVIRSQYPLELGWIDEKHLAFGRYRRRSALDQGRTSGCSVVPQKLYRHGAGRPGAFLDAHLRQIDRETDVSRLHSTPAR